MKKDPAWKKAQDHVNKILGLKGTRGSGNVKGDADGKNDLYMNESKYRGQGFISVPEKEWKKLIKESTTHTKIPIFTIIHPEEFESLEMFSVMRTEDLGAIINPSYGISHDDKQKLRDIFWQVHTGLSYLMKNAGVDPQNQQRIAVAAEKLLEKVLGNE